MNFLFVRKFNLATRQVKNAASHCVIDRAFGIAWSCFSDNCEPSSIVDVMRKITVLTATFNSYGDRQVSPPPTKSIPPNGSTKKPAQLITSAKGPPIPNLVEINSLGLLCKWVKYNKNYFYYLFFIYTFFSLIRLQVRPVDGFLRAIAQKTWNHTRMCLLGL